MAGLVIDSSIAGAWCFRDEATTYTESVLQAVSGPFDAIAPRLWAYEIRNTVLVGVRRGRIAKPDAVEFLQSLPALGIRLTDPPSYTDMFGLAERCDLTIYDAAYLALREGLPLASLDKDLIRAAQQVGAVMFQP